MSEGSAPPGREFRRDADGADALERYRTLVNLVDADGRFVAVNEAVVEMTGYAREERSDTGIGPALCRRVVERPGGTVRVDSDPGEGATFPFPVPATEDDEREE